jgi:DNA-binding transcriptional regulator YiaG
MKEYKYLMEKSKNTAILNGIKVKKMTIYRAELIYLRNEGLTAKEISSLLNTKSSTVENWYNKGSQPKDEIIEKLEEMFLQREINLIKKFRSPK